MNIVFRQHLKIFLKEHLNIDADGLYSCKTDSDILDYLTERGQAIAEALGVDLSDECDWCEEKDDRIYELLEKIDDFPVFETMDDQRKLEYFLEHHSKYTADQFEDLIS